LFDAALLATRIDGTRILHPLFPPGKLIVWYSMYVDTAADSNSNIT
jgi:hypothetical protein